MIRTAIAALGCTAIATNASVMSFTDDLTDGVFDFPFNYDFSSDFSGGYFNTLDAGTGLLLASDEVVITFDPSITDISAATLSIGDFTGGQGTDMTITFEGTLGEIETYTEADGGLLVPFVGDYTIGYSGSFDLASITVSGFEAVIRDVTIRGVPTPGAIAVAGIAGSAATRRRREYDRSKDPNR